MTVISVIAIVIGLLYAYSDQGWKLFYQSYGRGLTQVKAKLAIKTLSDDLREGNKNRLLIGQSTTYGVPLPDDAFDNSPYIYFTKPNIIEDSGDITGYDYILYYFAKPKEKLEDRFERMKKRNAENENFLVLKSIRFINQSKFYTEDEEKTWPFQPPILEINKARLPEDDAYTNSLNQGSSQNESSDQSNPQGQESFLDHFAKIKKYSRNIPISGNFKATALTDPFSKDETNISFYQNYSVDNPIVIKVNLEESPVLFGIMAAMSDFEIKITPRN